MKKLLQTISLIVFKSKKVVRIPVVSGKNTVDGLYMDIINKNLKSVFIASGKTIRNKGMLNCLIENLKSNNINVTIFSDIVPDPTIENVETGLEIFKKNKCECVIAVGGGSVLDCAKVIALRASNPDISVKLMGMYVIPCKKSVPIYAVPTTSGTGSEITFFSVITDTKNHKKLAILSDKYMPEKIVFDYELLRHVPEKPTVYAGLDALTHSIEAFISTNSRIFANDVASAPDVCRDIFEFLPLVAKEPDNKTARLKMAKASYKAGINFRRTSVGYVHAIAHRLGETYHIPHGLACAVVLPKVLKSSLSGASARLDELAIKSGIAESAEDFINRITELERELKIPEKFEEIDENDFPIMIKRIISEASLQGCPVMLDSKAVGKILLDLKM